MVRSARSETGILGETAAISFFFLAVFLLLCLVSYLLPVFETGQVVLEPSRNWCGTFGFFTAHYLFSFIGFAAFFPVVILCYISGAFLFGWSEVNRLPFLVAGVTGVLFSAAGLLEMHSHWNGAAALPPGGFVGLFVWTVLNRTLGTVGSALLLTMVFILSLTAAVRFSLLGTMQWSLYSGLRILAGLRRRIGKWRTQEDDGGRTVQVPKPAPLLESVTAQVAPAVHPPVLREPEKSEEGEEFSLKPLKSGQYRLPSITLLEQSVQDDVQVSREYYMEISKILAAKLQDFGVEGNVVGISPGPVVTTYEFSPAPGVKINKIVNLADDLAMVLKADRVRVVGSIPGKAAIGIEIPNPRRKMVFLRDILLSQEYRNSRSMLTLALGFDVIGRSVVADLARMPHLLIAGATGAGKSVAINAFIASILFKATPEDVRLLMIDPKRIELSVYEDIPHLLHPVVVEAKMASRALMWAVREMERRYRLLEEARVKSFHSYNKIAEEKLPYIVIIVDELADLMMVASKDVETSIARLAQMARAAGMHIILATQRPSVDVLTGLIKANFPTRISFKVSSKVDSRTVLDSSGAEHLLGMGDMLFLPPGAAKLQRIHGAFISEQETERLISFLKDQGTAEYDDSVLQSVEEEPADQAAPAEEYDEKYDEAVAVVTETGQASISMVQRRLRVGYNRAARMIETMEREGVVGPADGSRPREVLARSSYEVE